jgi:MerR family transcriptional regulator, light-induced transcriptional regulator
MGYTEPRYPMKVVVRRTGLTAHVLRVWERRYGAVTPQRTSTNRRLYSDSDIDRLRLLKLATDEGHSIGSIANRDVTELQELVRDAQPAPPPPTVSSNGATQSQHLLLQRCKEAAQTFDTVALEDALLEAKLSLSVPVLLQEVVTPLLVWVGDAWRDGSSRIAHEHLTSATVRKFLNEMRPIGTHAAPNAPVFVVSTPPGQQHETGALMASIVAATEGWRDLYLGPNIPMEEIANAARMTNAKAVGLSIVYPSDNAALVSDFEALKRYLNNGTAILVGGAGSKPFRGALEDLGAVWLPDLHALRQTLESLRRVDDIRDLEPQRP